MRPPEGGEESCAPSIVDPRAGTRVAYGFPLFALFVSALWLASNPAAPELSLWTLLVLPAICAAYGLYPVVLGARSYFSFEGPTILLVGLVGGPMVGVVAGVATGLGDVNAVWRRRSAFAGLAMLQGFAAGLVGDAWRSGQVRLTSAVVLAGAASVAISIVCRALILIDRQSWPSPWLARGTLFDLGELVLTAPFLILFAGAFSSSPGLVSLAVGAALAIVGLAVRSIAAERSRADRERKAQLLDPLTGALSRTAFEDALARQQARVLRGERWAGLLVCDIDHFGRFNERHGHLSGDRALRFVVERIQAAARGGDLVARWGGEELCLIAPGIGSLAELEALCERVRQSVTLAPLELEVETVSMTISVGATFLTDWTSGEETFARADEALYLAKRQRNVVCVLPPRAPASEAESWALASASQPA
jgi:diguanylate cyclase (GGDEF)-like protein